MFKIEQEGLAAEEEIHNEPNERETEPPPAFPPEPPAAYEKFRVGRERQQPKRWITTAQFALKVSFWSLGLWGHRAWKYIAHTFLVIVFVFLIIASACFAGPSTFCPISCKYTNLTEKERTFCYQCKFTNIVHAITVTASFLSYLVFAACYVVGKRTTSALVCPPQVLIKETGKPVIFVLFLAFLVMSVLISASLMALPFITAKIYPSIVIEVVLESFSLWVSLNVCHIFASICIVLGTFADDTLRLIRDVQNRTLDDVVRIHEDLCTVVFSTSSAYSLWFLLHVFCHGVGYILFVTLIFFMTAHKFEQNTLTPEYVVSLVYVQLPFFYLFISPLMFAAWISSRCAEIYEKINCSCTDDWNDGHPFKDRNNISLFVSYAKNRRCGFKAGRSTFYDSLTWVSFLLTVIVSLLLPIIQHGLLP